MRLFTSESFYNIKIGRWDERFWIDGIITDPDDYFFEQDREKKLEAEKLLKEIKIDPCEGCECRGCCGAEDEIEGFDYEDLLDIFVSRILAAEGCPSCTKAILDEFADIFLPDEDELDEINENLN